MIAARRRRGSALLVTLAAVLPCLPILRAPFMYDDTMLIRDNVQVHSWRSVWNVWATSYWPTEGLGLYRPLQLSLLSIVWNIGRGSAFAFHCYALILSILAALGVWWLLGRGASPAAALLGALWFATHPLHVEALASAANTSELIVTLCMVGMAWVLECSPVVLEGALRRSRSSRVNSRPKDLLLVLTLFAIAALAFGALAAKESGLFAAPAAFLVWRFWRRDQIAPRIPSRAWTAALCGVVAVLCARLLVLGTPIASGSIAASGLAGLSGPRRVEAMLSLWPRLSAMIVWPSALSPFYGASIFPDHRVLPALGAVTVLCCVLAGAVAIAMRGDARPLAAIGWIALSYLPASNLLAATGQVISDRTLFGATVGVALMIAWGVDAFISRMQYVGTARAVRMLALACFAVLVVRNTWESLHYAADWTSHRKLWTRLIAAEPSEPLGYKLQAMDLRSRGDIRGAIALLTRADALSPGDRQVRFELGQAQYQIADYAGAARTLSPLLRDADVRAEPQFVALLLDATGRAYGPHAVIDAASRLRHSEADSVARVFIHAATKQIAATGIDRR